MMLRKIESSVVAQLQGRSVFRSPGYAAGLRAGDGANLGGYMMALLDLALASSGLSCDAKRSGLTQSLRSPHGPRRGNEPRPLVVEGD